MGLCPNLLGSVIAMQAWMQHSPSEVVFATLRMTVMHKKNPELVRVGIFSGVRI